MATITEDYVSFETAKLLKEKGFDGECSIYYNIEEIKEMEENGDLETPEPNEVDRESLMYDYTDIYIKASTQTMAMKWLREMHKIHVIAEPCLGEGDEPNLSFNRWFWTILKEEGEYEPIRKIEEFSTYEEAIEAAIKYCLDNLI